MDFLTHDQSEKFYQPYFVKDWKNSYFRYDTIKSQLKASSEKESIEIQQYQLKECFEEEIKRVDDFLVGQITEVSDSLDVMASEWALAGEEDRQRILANDKPDRHSLERFFRRFYAKIKMLVRPDSSSPG